MTALGLTLGQIARVVKGTLYGDASMVMDDVSIDSRETCNGLFIAIVGDRFDGHDFASVAVSGGAAAVLVHKTIDGLVVPSVRVSDTLAALQALGMEKRRLFEGRVAAITGSSGKTTTRRILTAILATEHNTHGPIRNFNNHIGLPLTLLGLEATHEAAVLELGCSDFGEIAALTRMADPDVGLVTNVGAAHLEKLGSLDGVARAKGELFSGMREDTVAVVNMDDPRVASMPIQSKRVVRYGRKTGADVRLILREGLGIDGQRLVFSLFGRELVATLPLLGGHNALNALAATAAASMMGIPDTLIVSGLSGVTPEPGRLDPRRAAAGGTVIDDTYNANPNSMRAALVTLGESGKDKKTVAVLGDMLELGEQSAAAHLEIGRAVAHSGIDQLVTLGDQGRLIGEGAVSAGMSPTMWRHETDHDRAADWLATQMNEDVVVLVKGSRGMAMEKVVGPLIKG